MCRMACIRVNISTLHAPSKPILLTHPVNPSCQTTLSNHHLTPPFHPPLTAPSRPISAHINYPQSGLFYEYQGLNPPTPSHHLSPHLPPLAPFLSTLITPFLPSLITPRSGLFYEYQGLTYRGALPVIDTPFVSNLGAYKVPVSLHYDCNSLH